MGEDEGGEGMKLVSLKDIEYCLSKGKLHYLEQYFADNYPRQIANPELWSETFDFWLENNDKVQTRYCDKKKKHVQTKAGLLCERLQFKMRLIDAIVTLRSISKLDINPFKHLTGDAKRLPEVEQQLKEVA